MDNKNMLYMVSIVAIIAIVIMILLVSNTGHSTTDSAGKAFVVTPKNPTMLNCEFTECSVYVNLRGHEELRQGTCNGCACSYTVQSGETFSRPGAGCGSHNTDRSAS